MKKSPIKVIVTIAMVLACLGQVTTLYAAEGMLCNGSTECNNDDGCGVGGAGYTYYAWFPHGDCKVSPGNVCITEASLNCEETITHKNLFCKGTVTSDIMSDTSGCSS
jgi:hypothetical protein